MNLDERIKQLAYEHPEEVPIKSLDGSHLEFLEPTVMITEFRLKILIREVVEHVKPERMESTGDHLYQLVHGYNTALDEMEAKAKELGL